MNTFKYRIKSYWEFYSKKVKLVFIVLAVLIGSQLVGFFITGPMKVAKNDISFLKTADTIEIRYDAKFEIEKDYTTGDRIKPLSKEYTSFTVPAKDLYGENKVYAFICGENEVKKVRSKVIAELDFYEDGKLTGTIELITPRDTKAYDEACDGDDKDFWREINDKRVIFHKGSVFFSFIQEEVLVSTDKIPSIEENLETIIQNHLDAQ